MGFDNIVTVFGCSVVSEFMPKVFGFSMVSSSYVIIIDCFMGFKTDFVSPLFVF